MSNELATTGKAYNNEQMQIIRSQIAPKANPDELAYFLQQCVRTKLDPFSKQIYAIHRWNGQQGREVMSIQVSIDGFRVIAERSGSYGGQSEPEFIEKDGKLDACKVRVFKFRGDVRYEAAVGVAYWNEYVQTTKDGKPSGLWAKMPHVMLAKVAEALALRKAFPADLSGLYTSEEMQQADTQAEPMQEINVGFGNVNGTRVTIKEAKARAEEIKQAIKDLLDCQSVDDLKKLKADLADYVVTNESFKDAARQRYDELTAEVV